MKPLVIVTDVPEAFTRERAVVAVAVYIIVLETAAGRVLEPFVDTV